MRNYSDFDIQYCDNRLFSDSTLSAESDSNWTPSGTRKGLKLMLFYGGFIEISTGLVLFIKRPML